MDWRARRVLPDYIPLTSWCRSMNVVLVRVIIKFNNKTNKQTVCFFQSRLFFVANLEHFGMSSTIKRTVPTGIPEN